MIARFYRYSAIEKILMNSGAIISGVILTFQLKRHELFGNAVLPRFFEFILSSYFYIFLVIPISLIFYYFYNKRTLGNTVLITEDKIVVGFDKLTITKNDVHNILIKTFKTGGRRNKQLYIRFVFSLTNKIIYYFDYPSLETSKNILSKLIEFKYNVDSASTAVIDELTNYENQITLFNESLKKEWKNSFKPKFWINCSIGIIASIIFITIYFSISEYFRKKSFERDMAPIFRQIELESQIRQSRPQ